jgi:phospholipid/cholesterol/gamma-HCH transport system ATP-binding protein
MDAAVRFIDATLPPVLDGANIAFGKGTCTAVLHEEEDKNPLLLKALTGLSRLREGKVLVLGHDLGSLSRDGLNEVRRRIGIVYIDGGLISNLKVLENVTLPLLYHTAEGSREIESRAVAILERFGCGEVLMKLPGGLSTIQRRAAGFARVVAMEPEVVVYDRIAEGLDAVEGEIFLRTAVAFHAERPGRTSIFLTADPAPVARAGVPSIVHLRKGKFE